jgi:hypothetical protein
METSLVSLIGSILMLVVVGAVCWRLYRRRRHVGPGAIGAVQDILIEDKRRAIEIIVEERAEERRPEYADGNLPDLEKPKR